MRPEGSLENAEEKMSKMLKHTNIFLAKLFHIFSIFMSVLFSKEGKLCFEELKVM